LDWFTPAGNSQKPTAIPPSFDTPAPESGKSFPSGFGWLLRRILCRLPTDRFSNARSILRREARLEHGVDLNRRLARVAAAKTRAFFRKWVVKKHQ